MALARLSGFNLSASVTVTAASSELKKELIHADPVVESYILLVIMTRVIIHACNGFIRFATRPDVIKKIPTSFTLYLF